MRLYLDASVLVALLTSDALTARADGLLRSRSPVVLISDFAMAEFASAVARLVRMRRIGVASAEQSFATLDEWVARTGQRLETVAADVRAAEAFLRRLDLTLRTPDALNIAIAQRADASLATFDEKMAAFALALGSDVVTA